MAVGISKVSTNNNNKSALDNLIKKLSGDTKKEYVYVENIARKSFVDKSMQKLVDNSIIEGYFPKENLVKDMAIKRVNKSLCIILSIIVAVVVISYYFVISCEIKLNDISRQTVILNNENEELQNKLDSLKSFNNVDSKIGENKLLHKAEKVIEVTAMNSSAVLPHPKKVKHTEFNWAIGY